MDTAWPGRPTWTQPMMDSSATGILPLLVDVGPIVYGWVDSAAGARERLVARLLVLDGSAAGPQQSGLGADVRLTIEKDALGRPILFSGNNPEPAISFSHVGDRVYAALSMGRGVGCDVALAEEFPKGYPLSRAFIPEEFERALNVCHAADRAAALLWSLKEASAKALGVGFNLLDPLKIEVKSARLLGDGLLFEVRAGRRLWAWARPEGEGWLAVAAIGGDSSRF